METAIGHLEAFHSPEGKSQTASHGPWPCPDSAAQKLPRAAPAGDPSAQGAFAPHRLLVNTVLEVPALPLLFGSVSYDIDSTTYTDSALFQLDPSVESAFGQSEGGWLPTFEGHHAKALARRKRARPVCVNCYPAEHLVLQIR